MSVQRKRYSAEEKTKVAIEAIKGQKTLNELAAEYGVHPSQITQWKKQAMEEISTGFSGGRVRRERTDEALVASLYQEIGQLKMEMDWLKKTRIAFFSGRAPPMAIAASASDGWGDPPVLWIPDGGGRQIIGGSSTYASLCRKDTVDKPSVPTW
jgi:transposase